MGRDIRHPHVGRPKARTTGEGPTSRFGSVGARWIGAPAVPGIGFITGCTPVPASQVRRTDSPRLVRGRSAHRHHEKVSALSHPICRASDRSFGLANPHRGERSPWLINSLETQARRSSSQVPWPAFRAGREVGRYVSSDASTKFLSPVVEHSSTEGSDLAMNPPKVRDRLIVSAKVCVTTNDSQMCHRDIPNCHSQAAKGDRTRRTTATYAADEDAHIERNAPTYLVDNSPVSPGANRLAKSQSLDADCKSQLVCACVLAG